MSIKAFLKVTLVSLTLRARTVFLKFLKKCRQFRCTGLLRRSKQIHLDAKNLTFFFQNLVQNLLNLVLSSKSDRKWPKVAKTKTVQKTTYMWHSWHKC